MDCRNWDEDLYREGILREREALSRTVFRTSFGPRANQNPNYECIVAASSDGCIAAYSVASCLETGCGIDQRQDLLVAEPEFLIQGHEGPAYDVKFYDESLLLSCGDDGRIRGWKWETLSEIEKPIKGGQLNPVLDLLNPQHKGPWGALSPVPENNAISVDSRNKSIYAAAGDNNAYCWDLEKCMVKTVFKGHLSYLHCIVSFNLSSQIVTGSEDGSARMWDCRSGKCIKVMDADSKSKLYFPRGRVSCIGVDSSESWLACGKGQWLSVWNVGAGECVSRVRRQGPIQDVTFDENQMVFVGGEPVITRCNINGDILSEIRCAAESAFCVAVHPCGMSVAGGYGGVVDVISEFGSRMCSFRCKGLL